MRKRNRQICLWLNEKELDRLNKQVEKTGLSRQEYFLNLIKALAPIECPKPDLEDIRKLLVEDGTVINEIAHEMNVAGVIDDRKYIANVNNLNRHMNMLEGLIRQEIDRIMQTGE